MFTEQKLDVSSMAQVQLRLPDEMVKMIDNWVLEGKYRSRSDAIKTMIAIHMEREQTRNFYKMLKERSDEVRANPEILLQFEE